MFGDLRADLTLILDLPAPVGLARRRASAGANRFERMDAAYHERVREGFLAIARAEPGRCMVIDADPPAASVARAVRAAVQARLGLDLTVAE